MTRKEIRKTLETLDAKKIEQNEDFKIGRWVRTDVEGWQGEHLTVVKASEKAVCLALRNGVSSWIPKSWIKAVRQTTSYCVYEIKPFYRLFSPEQKLVFGHTF